MVDGEGNGCPYPYDAANHPKVTLQFRSRPAREGPARRRNAHPRPSVQAPERHWLRWWGCTWCFSRVLRPAPRHPAMRASLMWWSTCCLRSHPGGRSAPASRSHGRDQARSGPPAGTRAPQEPPSPGIWRRWRNGLRREPSVSQDVVRHLSRIGTGGLQPVV